MKKWERFACAIVTAWAVAWFLCVFPIAALDIIWHPFADGLLMAVWFMGLTVPLFITGAYGVSKAIWVERKELVRWLRYGD